MPRLGGTCTALMLLSALAAGPAQAGGFKCPEAGGRAWRELRTVHFLVQTDLSRGKAEDLAEELERVHEAIRFGLFRNPPDTGTIRVLALADEEEYDLFAPAGAEAHYARSPLSGPVIVMPGRRAYAQRILVAHEITHHVAARAFARQPPWFAEGLACVMESVATVGTPTVGGVPAHRHQAIYPYFGGVAKVLRAREGLATTHDYAVAWALVHYLMNRHPQEFGAIQQRFARAEDPEAAWRAVFPQWNPASDDAMKALDGEIGRYIAHGKFAYRDVKLPEAAPPSERPMTAAEVHDVRLSIAWRNRGATVEAGRLEAEMEEALRHDPGAVSALARAIERNPGEAVALAERATATHPEDARSWLLLALALPAEAKDRREPALRRAVAVDPSSSLAQDALARLLLQEGRTDEALPLARRAVELSPGSAAPLDTLAGVAEARGDCAIALQIQRRAMDLLPERFSEDGRALFRDRLVRLEGKCGTQQQAPPAPAVR